MDRLRAMAVFVAIADSGSLSGAARLLAEPLTNVSRMLAQLEQHLNLTLIDRTTRRMVLTSAGRDYLKTCRRILEDLQISEGRIAGLSNEFSGEISITAPVVLGRLHVLPVITEFLSAYPLIHVRLLLVDRVVNLMDEEIDIAIRVGQMKDSELRALRVGTLKLVACASPAYLDRRGTPATVASIAEHDCITFAELPGGSRWVFKAARHGRNAVRVRSRLKVNTADAAVSAAIDGVGIVRVLSYQSQAAIEAKLLKPILQRFDDELIPVSLVYRSTQFENSRVREFVRFASGRLRARFGDK